MPSSRLCYTLHIFSAYQLSWRNVSKHAPKKKKKKEEKGGGLPQKQTYPQKIRI